MASDGDLRLSTKRESSLPGHRAGGGLCRGSAAARVGGTPYQMVLERNNLAHAYGRAGERLGLEKDGRRSCRNVDPPVGAAACDHPEKGAEMKVRVYHNGDDVFIAWKPDGFIDGCRGFGLLRRRNGIEEVVSTWVGFEGEKVADGTRRASTNWPIQK